MTRHPLDVLSLGTGSMFVLFAMGYLVAPASMQLMVVVPLLLVGLGLFGIAAAVVAGRRDREEAEQA